MDEDKTASATSERTAFDRRLAEARERQGLDRAPVRSDGVPADAPALAVFFRVGVELVSAVLVGLAIGYGLDHFLHTKPLFLILFVLLGGVAGMVNVWRLVASAPNPGRKS